MNINNRVLAVSVLLLMMIGIACIGADDKTFLTHEEWTATRTIERQLTERTVYTIKFDDNNTYEMHSERSRKVGDNDYYAKITGSEREFSGEWSMSEDSNIITFVMPELKGDERASNFDGMELTVSDDGNTLTRSDVNADAVMLVFSRK